MVDFIPTVLSLVVLGTLTVLLPRATLNLIVIYIYSKWLMGVAVPANSVEFGDMLFLATLVIFFAIGFVLDIQQIKTGL